MIVQGIPQKINILLFAIGLAVITPGISRAQLDSQADPATARGDAELFNSVTSQIINSADHTTFGKALKQSGLDKKLSSEGPFTIFAPTDIAFNSLPDNKVKSLFEEGNSRDLKKLLLYHVVPGEYKMKKIRKAIRMGGKLVLRTLSGEPLTLVKDGEDIVVQDGSGTVASISPMRSHASNGVSYSIDRVAMQ